MFFCVRVVDPADEHWEAVGRSRQCRHIPFQRVAGTHLDSMVTKQMMDHDLYHDCREVHADALVCTRAERHEGKTVRSVLAPCVAEPLGIECMRVGPQARPVVVEPRSDDDHRVCGHEVPLNRGVHQGFPEDRGHRGKQPHRLVDDHPQRLHAIQRVQVKSARRQSQPTTLREPGPATPGGAPTDARLPSRRPRWCRSRLIMRKIMWLTTSSSVN